ncbi:phospholipase B domain containing lamina ancestor [Anticarsia gemmatalis]|uniref:phospholipase B domain containing lamina ancestor n=1 Tax=Anticarsia gemmatalis TaxID=129554 RepID=UPI003F7660C2
MSKILKVVGASWLQTKISSYILGILGVLAILALFFGQIERIQGDGNYAVTVFFSNKTGYRIEYWGQSNELADIPRGVARAYFRMDMENAGWSLLEVETDPSYSDENQAYAAGIVEGALTWSLIHKHLENTIRAKCNSPSVGEQCDKFRDALDESVKTWKTHAEKHAEDDPFWHQVFLYYTQISGIYTGWKHGVERCMKDYRTDILDLYWLNFVSEAIDIQRKINVSIDDDPIYQLPHLSSALLRVVDDKTEDGTPTKKLYVSQNAAGTYSSMTRILKKYTLNYHKTFKSSELVQGTSIEFSGYPGSITSQDEFYIVKGEKHRMAVTGTALRNYNNKLLKKVNIYEQVPVGPRVAAANRLAINVTSWGHILVSSNSGTASKQWLVVDFNKFDHLHTLTPRTEDNTPEYHDVVTESTVDKNVRHIVVFRHNNGHSKGLVALIEQVPGLAHSADLSDAFLKQGYWATYGLPFFKDIAETTHVNQMKELHGDIFSESESPRALLFKHGYKNATSLESILALMRHNNLTEGNSTSDKEECSNDVDCIFRDSSYWSVLGVRGDLASLVKEAYGVLDTKVVSGTLNKTTLEFFALSGPTYTEIQPNKTQIALNKGNIVPIYTKLLNDNPNITGIEIVDIVKHQQEKAEEDKMELLNKDLIKPFSWSESIYQNVSHVGLPDRWAFEPFSPSWSW